MAKTNYIITISRQFGSGGRLVGKKLAESLEIPFYDKELITMAAQQSGYSKEIFEKADERATNSLLYTLSMNSYLLHGMTGLNELPLNDRVFLIQSEIIRKMASEGPCVIVGRCADYVLKEHPRCLNFYIYADLQSRVDRATTVYGMEKEKAAENIQKLDKKRASYYNFYSNLRWGLAENYDLCVNSSSVGIDGTVEMLRHFIKQKENFSIK